MEKGHYLNLENISASFQENYLFDREIQDNIIYGENENNDTKRLINMFKSMGMYNFIKEKGLNYKLNHIAKNISGGEQKRISFMRAIYKNAFLYCFDEPTAELDEKSKEYIVDIISKLKQHATVIVVTHDSCFDGIADKIINLDEFDDRIKKVKNA